MFGIIGVGAVDQWTLLNTTAPFNVLANAKPIATSAAGNTGSYERRSTILQALDRSGLPSRARNTESYERRSTLLQALDRMDSASGTNSTGSSKGQQPPFSGQDAETQRAEQRAVRKLTNAYTKLDQALTDKGIQTSSLSGAGQDIYRSTRIAIANAVLQKQLDPSRQSSMIKDAQLGIAPVKTAPMTAQTWKERVSQADTASKEMINMLESVHVDTDHLTTAQSYIVEKAERQLRDGIISGALDENGIDEMIRSICNKVTSETTPPNGRAYVTIMGSSYQPGKQYEEEIVKKREELETSIDTTFDEMKTWLFDNRQIDTKKLTDAQKAEYYNTQRDIRNRLANGSLTEEERVQMYGTLANRLSSTEYDYEYENAYGKKVSGKITTDELIDPEDNSIGARLARYALELVNQNLDYNARIILNPRAGSTDIRRWISIDCSGLVKYAAYQINPEWEKKKIGNKAENQMKSTGNNVVWQKTANQNQPNINSLEAGDLLYWADENNQIVHTAIYLGDGLMVESEGSVRITDIRFTTIDNDGSEHKLVQINRLDETEEASYEENE